MGRPSRPEWLTRGGILSFDWVPLHDPRQLPRTALPRARVFWVLRLVGSILVLFAAGARGRLWVSLVLSEAGEGCGRFEPNV